MAGGWAMCGRMCTIGPAWAQAPCQTGLRGGQRSSQAPPAQQRRTARHTAARRPLSHGRNTPLTPTLQTKV